VVTPSQVDAVLKEKEEISFSEMLQEEKMKMKGKGGAQVKCSASRVQ
jgi:hypothetical protein